MLGEKVKPVEMPMYGVDSNGLPYKINGLMPGDAASGRANTHQSRRINSVAYLGHPLAGTNG